MQNHEGPSGDPENNNRSPRSTAWWLMLVIFGLAGLIVAQLILRWL